MIVAPYFVKAVFTDTSNEVTISAIDVPATKCPNKKEGKDITVRIVAYANITFARLIGRNQVITAVTAIYNL